MSQMRFCYDDIITDSTVITSNSEETLSPVEYMGNEILGKKYQTKTGFIIKSGYNNIFNFYEGRTGSSTVVGVALSSTTFTGSGLASAVQVAMRAGGKFSSQTVTYNSTTERFTATKASTATSMSLRFSGIDESISEIMGYLKQDYATGTTFISAPTKGNQQWVEMSSPGFSADALVLHEHNFSSGTVLKLRAQSTSTYFHGLNQYGHGNGIFQAFTNLVLHPCDLRAAGANWTLHNSTDEISTLSINGNLFTKVINSGANSGYNNQALTTAFTNLVLGFSTIVKKGNTTGNTTHFVVWNTTRGKSIGRIIIDWDNFESSPGVVVNGTLLDYKWIDSETLSIYLQCDTLDNLTDDIGIRCYGSNTATAGEYTYWSEVQLIDDDEIIMFPFVDGTHPADTESETFTLLDSLTGADKFKPAFAYDVATVKTIRAWYIDATHFLTLAYDTPNFILTWYDGGTSRTMTSAEFDDGSAHIDIDQILTFGISVNLTSAGANDSRFIIIEEDDTVNEITAWSGAPDVKSSIFPTKAIGWSGNSGLQADSNYEYSRDYSGLLVGVVTSSDTFEALLTAMTRTLNLDYKNTTYMKYLATSTTFGQFEQEITVNEDPCVTLLDEAIAGNVFQLSWTDIKNSYSEIGRAFLSPIFYPANHPDNKISWFKKKILRRSKRTMAESGATYFDKKDSVEQYTLLPDPLNEYYNPTTKTNMEAFLDAVGDSECFYTILDSSLSNTVYGFIIGNTDYNRQKNTPTIIVPKLLIQEQK